VTTPTTRTLYTADWVLPIATAPIAKGAVLVEGARIAWVGTQDAVPAHVADDVQLTRAPLGHAALMPGLVNAHSHLELTVLRGFLEGLDFRSWLRALTDIRRDLLTDQDLLDSARLGLMEALTHGITTVADCTDSALPLTAMREFGVRGIGYVETFGPDPRQCGESIARLRERVSALRTADTALVRVGVSPHAPYTVSAALFRATAEYAIAEALPMAVHVAESEAETAFVRDGTGPFAERLRARGIPVAPQARSPVALLEEAGVLAARPLLVHAIRAVDEDFARIAHHGATLVHCPVSNAKLGHGMAALDRMLAHGIPTGLGSDSVASNDRMHLLEEARQATLLHAIRAGLPDSFEAHAALRLATQGGAAALQLEAQVGTLEVGKQADLAAFPLDAPEIQPVYDPAVTLVHALAGRATASLVTVAGRVLVRDGALTAADLSCRERLTATSARLGEWRARVPALYASA
jgi:cytosine/adenosine deaminase-related metal-dependent hydrolase